MKTIVISGARSNVGKTTLAEDLCGLLPGGIHVKLGHGNEKKGAGNIYYRAGTPFETIVEENPDAGFLVIESNRILEEIEPDLAIYLPADDPKSSAALARKRADLTRGCSREEGMARQVAARLGIDAGTAGEIVRLVCRAGGTKMDD